MMRIVIGLLCLALSGTSQGAKLPANGEPIDARLRCDRETVAPGDPLVCWVSVEVDSQYKRTMIVPQILVPGAIPTRPPAIIEFELAGADGSRKLEIAPPAQRGRYDLATLSSDNLVALLPGRSIGFQYDLNGADWLLPSEAGTYSLRAVLRVGLLERDSNGNLEKAVVEKLGSWVERASELVMDGTWTSNWTTLRIENAPPR